MALIDLAQGTLSARLSTQGGLILGFWTRDADGRLQALMRSSTDDAGPLQSACFPLLPFGNRLRGNRFRFGGTTHHLQPNVGFDPLYLHGDGWLGGWTVVEQADDRAVLRFAHQASDASPYDYEALQSFELHEKGLRLGLEITNRGASPLPFGLGWHPYFPMTDSTTLRAPAGRIWTEGPGYLPVAPVDIPAELEFAEPRRLPGHWVNNGFEAWPGSAEICWPDCGLGLAIEAEAGLGHYVLFRSDVGYDPGFTGDWFCFEPMSHLADGHNLPDGGGLRVLHPGESLSAAMMLQPFRI